MGITKQAEDVLKTLYGIYKKRLKYKIPRPHAMRMGVPEILRKNYFSNIDRYTFNDILFELKRLDLLSYEQYGTEINKIQITYKAIVWFEHAPMRKLSTIAEFILNFV